MKTPAQAHLQRVIADIHTSPGNSDAWGRVLEGIRELLQARVAAIGRYDFQSGKGHKLMVTPENRAFCREYAERHAVRNPWFIASREYQVGRVMSSDELLREKDFAGTDFYLEFLRKYGLYHRLCGVLIRSESRTVYVAVYRDQDEERFKDLDREVFKSIVDHLIPAIEHHWALLYTNSFNDILRAVVDDCAPAIFLVENDARLCFASRKATALLNNGDGLRRQGSRIAAKTHFENKLLRDAIDQVFNGNVARGSAGDVVKVIQLSRGACTRPLIVSVRPAGDVFSAEVGEYQKVVALVVKHADVFHQVEYCSFAQAYNLTRAQARLTSLLLAGFSMIRAAERLGISDNTARSHLKQIFQKTETHSQMELVHLHAQTCTEYLG